MINKFLNRKLIFTTLFSIPFLIFIILAILSPIFINKEKNNWETILTDKIEATQTDIDKALDRKSDLLIRSFDSIKPTLSKILSYKNVDNKKIIQLFSIYDNEKILIQLYNGPNILIGWNAQPVMDEESISNVKYYYGQTFFSGKKLISYLSFSDSLKISNHDYTIVISTPIEKHFSLSNKYNAFENFPDSLSKKLSVRINVDYSPLAKSSKDGRKYSYALLNNFKNKIGIATFDKPSLETSINLIKNQIWLMQSLTLIFALITLGFFSKNSFNKVKSKSLKILLLTIYLAVLRIALFYFEIPSSMIHNSLTDSSNFSSVFGYGIVRSPLEFTITVLFLLTVVIKGYNYFLEYFYENQLKGKKRIVHVITLIFSLFLYLLVYRGLAASIRSVIFDSNIRYFKDFSLIPESSVFLMCLNILLLASAAILFSIILILLILNYKPKLFPKNKFTFYLIYFFIFQISGWLFDLLQNEPQGTPLIRIIFITITFLLALIILNAGKKSILHYVYYSFAASVLSVSLLTFYNSEIERESLKTTAHDITRTDENLIEFMVYQTLSGIQTSDKVANSFFNDADLSADAFIVWTNSMLYKEGLSSSIYFYDDQKKYLGGFSSSNELLTDKLQQIIEQSGDSLKISKQLNMFGDRVTFIGTSPILSEGKIIGYVLVSAIYNEDYFHYAELPKFLIPLRAGIASAIDYDKLKIFDFHNGELVRSYGGITLSDSSQYSILNSQFTSFNEAWMNLELNNENYLFYLLKINTPSIHKIIAVAVEEKNFSWSLTDFFKIFFIHTIIILFILSIVFIVKMKQTIIVLSAYRTRLIGAFMVVSLVPLILVAVYFRNLTEEKNSELLTKRLTELAQQVESYLSLYSTESNINSQLIYEKAANDINISFSLFMNINMIYSSNKIFYEIGLLPQTLPAPVYNETVLSVNQNYYVKEKFENQTIHSIYHRSSINGDEFIIKVSDLFNKVDLPLSDIELDIILFGIFSLAGILLSIFSTILAEQISSPIRRLTGGTKSVGEGDLNVEINYGTRGEIKDLIDGFNAMVKRLKQSQIELAQFERETAWKEMAKQVAHEIKNPLTPMRLNVQQLITAHKDKSPKFNSIFEKVTSSIITQIEILKNIASEFSNFAQMPKLSISKLDAVSVIKETLNLFNEEKRKIIFDAKKSEIFINADQDHLKRTIVNLIRNSIQADSTIITVAINAEGGYCHLRIKDNGEGIPRENIDKVFNENFTTKTKGMGIGLNLAKRFIDNIGGSISVESTPDEGTTFLITIPLAE
ncbi:MAG: HAMP domain-containing protein [Ignavibacteriales bacterium]|nr:MAG: HAMP domain-containing protein [Ignavibacteriales bacterium]